MGPDTYDVPCFPQAFPLAISAYLPANEVSVSLTNDQSACKRVEQVKVPRPLPVQFVSVPILPRVHVMPQYCAHAFTGLKGHTHTRTHARTHARTHRQTDRQTHTHTHTQTHTQPPQNKHCFNDTNCMKMSKLVMELLLVEVLVVMISC